jgi:hypothetical protein
VQIKARACRSRGFDFDVAFFVDAIEICAPVVDTVKIRRFFGIPITHCSSRSFLSHREVALGDLHLRRVYPGRVAKVFGAIADELNYSSAV